MSAWRKWGPRAVWMVLLFLPPVGAIAGDGPLGIDHELSLDERGIWARKYQTSLKNMALSRSKSAARSGYLGNDNERLGHVRCGRHWIPPLFPASPRTY